MQKDCSPIIPGMGLVASVISHSSPSQPYAKRARVECTGEEEYRAAVQAAAGALETVGVLLYKSPAPDWLPTEMELLQERVEALKRRVL